MWLDRVSSCIVQSIAITASDSAVTGNVNIPTIAPCTSYIL